MISHRPFERIYTITISAGYLPTRRSRNTVNRKSLVDNLAVCAVPHVRAITYTRYVCKYPVGAVGRSKTITTTTAFSPANRTRPISKDFGFGLSVYLCARDDAVSRLPTVPFFRRRHTHTHCTLYAQVAATHNVPVLTATPILCERSVSQRRRFMCTRKRVICTDAVSKNKSRLSRYWIEENGPLFIRWPFVLDTGVPVAFRLRFYARFSFFYTSCCCTPSWWSHD